MHPPREYGRPRRPGRGSGRPRGAGPAALRLPSWLLVAGLLGGVVTACGDDAGSFDAPPPVTVETLRVERSTLVDTAVFSGQLDAERTVVLRPEIEGVVESIEFTQGESVQEGAVLFRLRDGEQAARLREAKANRELARVRWERTQKLVSRDAQSLARADEAKAEYEIAQARVDLAQVALDRTRIEAPFDGVVGEHRVDVGARVDDETELVRIDQVDRLQVTFAITDEGLPLARPGMKVEVWVRPYPGEKFPGEVFYVSPTLDPRNRRIYAKAWIDNSEGKLAPGLFANVDLEVRQVDEALVVPESAVAIDQQGAYVWVIDEERRASRRPVEIGLRERGVVEIEQGLSEGTEIVVAGTHKVVEGKTVEISSNPLVGRAKTTPPEGALIGEGT